MKCIISFDIEGIADATGQCNGQWPIHHGQTRDKERDKEIEMCVSRWRWQWRWQCAPDALSFSLHLTRIWHLQWPHSSQHSIRLSCEYSEIKQTKKERKSCGLVHRQSAGRPTDGRTHVDVVATSADKLPNRITNDDGAILHYYYQPPKAITKAKTMQTIVLRRDSTR